MESQIFRNQPEVGVGGLWALFSVRSGKTKWKTRIGFLRTISASYVRERDAQIKKLDCLFVEEGLLLHLAQLLDALRAKAETCLELCNR